MSVTDQMTGHQPLRRPASGSTICAGQELLPICSLSGTCGLWRRSSNCHVAKSLKRHPPTRMTP